MQFCCLVGRRIETRPTRLRAPKGPHSHPRCYAGALGGCSKTISLEHYISHNALKLFGDVDGRIAVSNLAWQEEGVSLAIQASKFGARILCTAHNEALSPLDSCGAGFFAALHAMPSELQRADSTGEDYLVSFSGVDLERWLLKMLVGFAIGGAREGGRDWMPPRRWLRVLFGFRELENNMGLSCLAKIGERTTRKNRIELAPVLDTTSGEIIGLRANLMELRFSLLLRPVASKVGVYRPGRVEHFEPSMRARHHVFLGWRSPDGRDVITLAYERPE